MYFAMIYFQYYYISYKEDIMSYERPEFKSQYENYIGGEWVPPVDGEYFEDTSPVDGSILSKVAKSNSKDVDLAVAAAKAASVNWGKTSVTDRSNLLFKIADRIEENLENLALVETWDNGKAIRETMAADIPLAIDHFRYFGSVIRAESGDISDLDAGTVSMEIHEPLGVVGQIIPWNFPILIFQAAINNGKFQGII
jgi:aldehyde dehydrogenase